jgi:hypothetical protein
VLAVSKQDTLVQALFGCWSIRIHHFFTTPTCQARLLSGTRVLLYPSTVVLAVSHTCTDPTTPLSPPPQTLHSTCLEPQRSKACTLNPLLQVAYVKGGLPSWVREGYPMTDGPEDESVVPALQAGAEEEEEGSSKGGFKFPGGFKLPQLSFGSSRR